MRAICANPASPQGENDFFRNQTGKLGLFLLLVVIDPVISAQMLEP